MHPLLIPAVAILGGLALFMAKKPPAKMTMERQMLFQKIINSERDPSKLRGYANEFRKDGLTIQADVLEKRAKLRELPADVKAQRKAAFKKAMASTDKASVLKMASIYESDGAIGAAAKLRDYAKGL